MTDYKIFFLIFSFFITSPKAHAGYCENENILSISRPIYSKNPNAGSFNYRFSYTKRDNPDATVLIFIPGGPGQTSIEMGLSHPESFAVVRTDPRSIGCNQGFFPHASLTSEEIARDILSIVRKIKPKRYILHGISYGTVVATLVAALAEEENLAKPDAVVLEGTIGRTYSDNEYLKSYFENWQRIKNKLPPIILQQLNGPVLPMGYNSIEWATWISSMLIYGETPSGDELLYDYLLLLNPEFNDDQRISISAQLKRTRTLPSAEKTLLYREIICRELVPDVRDVKFDFDFINSDLVAAKMRLCTGIPLSRPYDSAKLQIKVPIYYFSGALDPVTPSFQTNYHFNNQKGPKVLVELSNGGHQTLSINLMDCSTQLWLAIDSGEVLKFKEALSQCAHAKKAQLRIVK